MKEPATEEADPGVEEAVDIIVEEWEVREDLLSYNKKDKFKLLTFR